MIDLSQFGVEASVRHETYEVSRSYTLEYTLMHGDAAKMLKKIPDSSVDLVVTSPPYWTMRGEVVWDSFEDYIVKMWNIFEQVMRVLKPGRVIAVNMSDYIEDGERFDLNWHWHGLLKRCGFKYRDTIIWEKTGELATISAGKMASNFLKFKLPMYYSPDRVMEVIMIFSKGKVKIPKYNADITALSKVNSVNRDWLKNVWKFAPRQDKDHKAVFPVELPKRLITLYSYYGETVLDPFLGSGTTMKVAKELGRSCIGCEIEEKYIPVIKRNVRWGEVGLGNVEYKYQVIK
jgi:DNA modification methylase